MEVQVLAQQRHLWTYFRIKCGTEGNFIAFGWIHLNFRFTWLAAELETPTGRALPEWGAEWFIRTAEVPAGGRAEDFFTIEESPNRGSKGGSNPQKWLPILSSFFPRFTWSELVRTLGEQIERRPRPDLWFPLNPFRQFLFLLQRRRVDFEKAK